MVSVAIFYAFIALLVISKALTAGTSPESGPDRQDTHDTVRAHHIEGPSNDFDPGDLISSMHDGYSWQPYDDDIDVSQTLTSSQSLMDDYYSQQPWHTQPHRFMDYDIMHWDLPDMTEEDQSTTSYFPEASSMSVSDHYTQAADSSGRPSQESVHHFTAAQMNASCKELTDTTEYWLSLRDDPDLKTRIIDTYLSLIDPSMENLSRATAIKRLRTRCDEQTASNLLSDDSHLQKMALRTLEFSGRDDKILTPLEKKKISHEMCKFYDVQVKSTASFISLGLKRLPEWRRIEIKKMHDKDESTFALLAKELHTAALDYHHEYQNKSTQGHSQEPAPEMARNRSTSRRRLRSRYWAELSEAEKDELRSIYQICTNEEPTKARFRLETRISKKLARALLSKHGEAIEAAVRYLDRPFDDEDDILIPDDKDKVLLELKKLRPAQDINYQTKIYNEGSRALSQEERETICGIQVKTPETYRWIAELIDLRHKELHRAASQKLRQRKKLISLAGSSAV